MKHELLTWTAPLAKKEARITLALAVALWMAGGRIASANTGLIYRTPINNQVALVGEQGWTGNNAIYDGSPLTVSVVAGGYAGHHQVTNNTITIKISGNDPLSAVYGGYANEDNMATNNTVIIESGNLNGANIYGGYANLVGTTIVTGNKVIIKGGTLDGANIYGGKGLGGGHVVTGNTLSVSGAYKPASVQNFSKINIEGAKWGTAALTVSTISNEDGSLPDINTEGIVFSGIDLVNAGGETPLITGGMAGYAGHEDKITGSTYKVGSTLQGKGHTVLEGANLKYVADTSAESIVAREQTHNTVMGAEVGMAALSVGNEFIGAATEGLSLAANTGTDGVASFAQMGGGALRQETGSHVDVHTWNAILGLGHKNEKERGTMEYGAFFEYGTGNYTTHAENDLRGDGSARYTGGGLLAKYTTRNNVYVEGSLRAGSVHDDARNVMSDAFGNPYSYDTNAPYLGFHLGVGKEIALSDGNSVDVYGKYFFNRKNGVSFDAGGHYDLDAVTSSVIRFGARYTVKRDKWNFYGGLAYEHELDGKAGGTADGVEIRGADTGGGSFRGEIGAIMKPGENSPITLDLNLSGFAGKKQGFTGGVSVAFMF